MKPDHPKYEPLRQELIRSAMHEINDLVKEYRLYLDEYVQTTRVARVPSMVPTVGQWPAIVRQQNALERLLERKIRLLMELQEHRILYGAPAPGIRPPTTPPPDPTPSPDPAPKRDPAPQRDPALSQGERVARDSAFTSRRRSGEGSLHCCHHPSQNTENSGNELHDLLQPKALTTNDPSKRTVSSAQNELVSGKNESGAGEESLRSMPCRRSTSFAPIHEPTPHPSCSGWRKRRSPTPSPLGRGLLRRAGGMPATASVSPTFRSACRAKARRYIRRGSGEGSLHCHTHPAQNTNNSGNELHDLLQSKALTSNDPSKRTVSEAPNELLVGVHESVGPARPIHEPTPHPSCPGWRSRRSPTPSPQGRGLLSRVGERPVTASVAPTFRSAGRDKAWRYIRRGSVEGSFPCRPRPAQNKENSRNELHDLLKSKVLTTNDPSKRTVSEAPNELLVGVHESVGPARPIHEPTPHPSCAGWRKRRSPTPSPQGRGLLRRVGGMPARRSVAPIPPLRERHAGLKPGATAAAGLVRGHFVPAPAHHNTQKIVGTNSTIYCSHRV